MFRQKMNFGECLQESSIPVAVEQFGAKEFFSNYAGWTRNDINALQACTTKAQYDALMQRLSITDPKYNVKEGTKVVDALKAAIPRWCQSPNELQSYAAQLAQDTIDLMDEEYQKSLQEAAKQSAAASEEPETKQDA